MLEWFDKDSTERSLRELDDAGVHAMGRRSYEIMGPHWSVSEGPVAAAMNDTPKAVFSRTLKKTDWGPAVSRTPPDPTSALATPRWRRFRRPAQVRTIAFVEFELVA